MTTYKNKIGVTKTEAYLELKGLCDKYGFNKSNSSFLTLLLPPNSEIRQEAFLHLVKKLLHGFECIISIEPVVGFSETYANAHFKEYKDNLPFCHAHIIIKEKKYEVRVLKDDWFKLVGSSKKRLFHCTHLRETITSALDYMTKYFEKKYNASPIFGYSIQEKIIEEKINSLDAVSTIYGTIKKSFHQLLKKAKQSSLLSKLFFSLGVIFLMTSINPESSWYQDDRFFTIKDESPP